MRNFINKYFENTNKFYYMFLFVIIIQVFCGSIFTFLSAKDFSVLKDGTKVVLVSYADENKPRILRIGKGGQLVPKSIDPEDVGTHFIIHRDGDFVVFVAAATGDTVQVLPKLQVVRLSKEGAPDWGKWIAEFDNPSDPESYVYLKNRASGGYLSAPTGKWTLGRMWTTVKEKIKNVIDSDPADPAPKNNSARLKIFIADDFIKQMSKKNRFSEVVKKKVVDVVREIEPLHAIPGGKDFTYSPIIHRMKTKYHDNWKFDTLGSGYVVFDARAVTKMIISFSSVPRDLDGGMYHVAIGYENNTRTGIRKNATGSMIIEENILKGASKDIVITGGIPEDGKKFDSYWIMVDKGIVSYGKGRIVGKNELMRLSDPEPLSLVSFVGFGGGKLHRVHYKNIEIGEIQYGQPIQKEVASDFEEVSSEIVLPPEFVSEQIVVEDFAVGIYKNNPELFYIIYGDLYFSQYSDSKNNEFVKIDLQNIGKVRQVSVGPRDGSVFVLNEDGKVFRYKRDMVDEKTKESESEQDKGVDLRKESIQAAVRRDLITDSKSKRIQRSRANKKSNRKKRKTKKNKKSKNNIKKFNYDVARKQNWIPVSPGTNISLVQISAGSNDHLVGFDEAGKTYKLINDSWQILEGINSLWISAGSDGSIFAIGKDDKRLYRWGVDIWKRVEGPYELSRLFVLDENHIWGILDQKNGSIVWQFEQENWARPLAVDGKTPVSNWNSVSVAPGFFLISDLSGNLFSRRSRVNRVKNDVSAVLQKVRLKKENKKKRNQKGKKHKKNKKNKPNRKNRKDQF